MRNLALLLFAAAALASPDRLQDIRKRLAEALAKDKKVEAKVLAERDHLARKDVVGKTIAPTLLAVAGQLGETQPELAATATELARALDPTADGKQATKLLRRAEIKNKAGYQPEVLKRRKEIDELLKKKWPAYVPFQQGMEALRDTLKREKSESGKLLHRMLDVLEKSDTKAPAPS
ncbi:MAG: hypothetical protein ACYTGN_04345 [Planctomycetota bacterium]